MTLAEQILHKMMELPHRGTGTENEKKAADFIFTVYKQFGLSPIKDEFPITFQSLNLHGIISCILFLLVLIINFLNIGLLTILVFIIAVCFYFQFPVSPLKYLSKKFPAISQNIIAEVKAIGESKYTMVLIGHYDTGSDYSMATKLLGPLFSSIIKPELDNPATKEIRLPWYLNNPWFAVNFAVVITVLSLFVPDFLGKLFFAFIAAIPFLIALFILFNAFRSGKFTPGAYDNGVGTTLVMDIAEYFHKTPLNNINLVFINNGAEEGLTHGLAHTLANTLSLNPQTTLILDFDCIGETELMLVDSEPSYPLGILKTYDRSFMILQGFFNEVTSGKIKVGQTPTFSDNGELIDAGFRVMGMFVTMPEDVNPVNFHSMKDTFDKIKWDKVEELREYCIGFLEYLDELVLTAKL